MHISENIRLMRKQRGMMQEQLAEALGVSVGAVSKWERGAAVPDLSYIMQMADLFGVSVDVLIGYRVKSGGCEALEERIHRLQQEKNYKEAAMEAEKALVRYPNHFVLVYRCGEMYTVMGIENHDPKALERAIQLLEHAILLLPQNTDSQINEFTIQAEIAQCHIVSGNKDKGLELLKKYNAGGVHNAIIGMICAASEEYSPEDAAPYLMKAYGDILHCVVRTMSGYINYYVRRQEFGAALDAALWLAGYLESIKIKEDSVTYVDKLRALLYADCACFSEKLANGEAAERYLRKAFAVAKSFDAAPVYKVDGIRFCIGEKKNGTAYDDIGASAMDAVETTLRQAHCSENLRSLWQRLCAEGS